MIGSLNTTKAVRKRVENLSREMQLLKEEKGEHWVDEHNSVLLDEDDNGVALVLSDDDAHHGDVGEPRIRVVSLTPLKAAAAPSHSGGGGIFRSKSGDDSLGSSMELYLSMTASSEFGGDEPPNHHQKRHQRDSSSSTAPLSPSSPPSSWRHHQRVSKPTPAASSPQGTVATVSSADDHDVEYRALIEKLLFLPPLRTSATTDSATKIDKHHRERRNGNHQQKKGNNKDSGTHLHPTIPGRDEVRRAAVANSCFDSAEGSIVDTERKKENENPIVDWGSHRKVRLALAALTVSVGSLGFELINIAMATAASSPPTYGEDNTASGTGASLQDKVLAAPWTLLSSSLAVAASFVVYREERKLLEISAAASQCKAKKLQERKRQLLQSNTHQRSLQMALQTHLQRLKIQSLLSQIDGEVASYKRYVIAEAVLEAMVTGSPKDWQTRLERIVSTNVPGCAVDKIKLEELVADQRQRRASSKSAHGMSRWSIIQKMRQGSSSLSSSSMKSETATIDARLVAKLLREAMDERSRVFVVIAEMPSQQPQPNHPNSEKRRGMKPSTTETSNRAGGAAAPLSAKKLPSPTLLQPPSLLSPPSSPSGASAATGATCTSISSASIGSGSLSAISFPGGPKRFEI